MVRPVLPAKLALSHKTAQRGMSRIRSGHNDSSQLILRQDIPTAHCGSIRLLRFNNPTTRNAISKAFLNELQQQILSVQKEAEKHQARALILASNVDASFCSGADLKERIDFNAAETREFLANLRRAFRELSQLPIPTISAVSSLALGGGLELALCTHFRVFASTATVALPESRLGIIPGAGGTYRLPAVIGRTRALDMILTGRRVAAAEAYFLGLCDRLVPIESTTDATSGTSGSSHKDKESRLLAEASKLTVQAAIDYAREICEGGPVAIQKIIESANSIAAMQQSQDDESRENEAYDGVVDTEDRTEALKAFKEKRKPSFKGR